MLAKAKQRMSLATHFPSKCRRKNVNIAFDIKKETDITVLGEMTQKLMRNQLIASR